jgi:protein-L-isoaspartate(D-aspartate) O-methyltransferase
MVEKVSPDLTGRSYMGMETNLIAAREALIASLRNEIVDERTLQAMHRVPREEFVPPDLRHFAYDDRPLPIGHGQTISQPLMVATMTEALHLKGDEKVLEIGTGSGYQTAILAELAERVVTVERVPELADVAERRFRRLAYGNISVHVTGPTLGWPEEAPYDAILVTAGAPRIPRVLVEQLSLGGRLIIPVGGRTVQQLVSVTRQGGGVRVRRHGQCRFVPLIGDEAWPESQAQEY